MTWNTGPLPTMPYLDGVAGWLMNDSAEIIKRLLDFQTGTGQIGDVLEIGVYEGRLFLILAHACVAGERAVAIDTFEQGGRDVFEDRLKKNTPPCEILIMESNSEDVTSLSLRGRMMTSERRPFRFISIDGGHSARTTESDLWLAQSVIMEGGLVTLDDWRYDGEWPGVKEGHANYTANGGQLQVVAEIPNKLVMSFGDPSDYQRVLADYAKE